MFAANISINIIFWGFITLALSYFFLNQSHEKRPVRVKMIQRTFSLSASRTKIKYSAHLFLSIQWYWKDTLSFSILYRSSNEFRKKYFVPAISSLYFIHPLASSMNLKFIYSEKTTKFCEIFTFLLTGIGQK